MLIDVDASDPRPVYRQIADEVQRCIAVGILRRDEALPAVRELAAQLKVNANTVQQAYRTLEREGSVYVKRGLGTFAGSPPRETKARQSAIARQIAERALRDAFKHGLLASDLIAALEQIQPRRG